MGKNNFKDLYRRVKSEQGTVTCEISIFSDKFNPLLRYAGVIIYAIDGKFEWENRGEPRRQTIQQRYIRLYEFFLFLFMTDRWWKGLWTTKKKLLHHYTIYKQLARSLL